jgi:hypothetical protein
MATETPDWLSKEKMNDELYLGRTSSYECKYWLYSSTRINHTEEEIRNAKKLKKIKNDNSACFAAFSRLTKEFKEEHGKLPSRLLYYSPFVSSRSMYRKGYQHDDSKNDGDKCYLTSEETRQWIELCVQYGFFPAYVDVDQYHSREELIIKLNGLDRDLLFFYLNNARYINEIPGIIRATLHIYNKGKVPFTFAYIMGHIQYGNSGGHAAMPCFFGVRRAKDKYGYMQRSGLEKPKELVKAAHRLRRFIKRANSTKHKIPIEEGRSWALHARLEGTHCSSTYKVPKSVSNKSYDSLSGNKDIADE